MWPAHHLQLPQCNELMSFCSSESVMNSYLEQSLRARPKAGGAQGSVPRSARSSLLSPAQERPSSSALEEPKLDFRSNSKGKKTLFHQNLFFRQFLVISPPKDFGIVISEREGKEAVEQEGRAGGAVGEQKGKGRDGQQAGCAGSEQLPAAVPQH